MKPREVEKLIIKDGWYLVGQVGSHRQYKHPSKPGKVTIPWHKKELKTGTLESIKDQAGIKD